MTALTTHAPAAQFGRPRGRIPYGTIGMLLAAGLLLGTIACFSIPAAAIVYVPFFLIFCWFRPTAALVLMWAEVAFPFNVNGTGLANTAPAEISLCLALPIFWLRTILARRPRVPNPMSPAVWAYFLICCVSTLVHWDGRDAIVSILQMALYLVIAVKFFSRYVTDRSQMFAAMYGLIGATTFVALIIIGLRREQVMGIHKNATGTFLSYTVLMLVELWLLAASAGRSRKWLNILLAINVGGLVMSTSRGAWLGTLAGLSVIFISRRQYGLFFRGLLLVIPAIVLCWFLMPQEQRDYALDLGTHSHSSADSRFATIAFFKEQFEISPIIGVGVGLRKEHDSTNVVMSTLAETGVVGLIAFLAIQVSFFWTVYLAMKRVPRNHPDFTILVLGAALVLCLFTHGMVDHYWSRTQLPVWGMAGAAIAIAYSLRSDRAWRR
jgi:O-antigen ligase